MIASKIAGLIPRFDEVLAELGGCGWLEDVSRQASSRDPRQPRRKLDDSSQQIRSAPLETTEVLAAGWTIRVPTRREILRIKAWLIVQRNATRDYIDVAAIGAKLRDRERLSALAPMDRLYPQTGDTGAVRQQLMRQLASPRPFDLEALKLDEYKGLSPQWRDWGTVVTQGRRIATLMANAVATRRAGWTDPKE